MEGFWSLKVSNKVENMVWRACRNSLPTKMNLVRCMIIDSPICDRCQDSPESVLHGLWSCREVDIVGQMRSYGVFGQVCISTTLKIL